MALPKHLAFRVPSPDGGYVWEHSDYCWCSRVDTFVADIDGWGHYLYEWRNREDAKSNDRPAESFNRAGGDQ